MTTTTEAPKIKASFAARYLPIVALFAAKQDIRYYLNGICVRRAPQKHGGVYVIATNGHCLAIIHDSGGTIEGADEVIFKISNGMVSASKKRSTMPNKVLLDDQRVVIAPDFDMIGTDMEAYVQPGRVRIEANYPSIEKVIPNFARLKPGMQCTVRAEYLAYFDKMLTKSQQGGVRFWHETPGNGSVVVQSLHIPELLGIIMPMHDDPEYGRKLFDKFPCKD